MEKLSNKFQVSAKAKIYEYESVDLSKTFPEWNSPLLSPNYTYIQIYKELNNVKKKLKEKEKEVVFHTAQMNSKLRELRKKQLEFLSDVQNYNAFFMENEEKYKRVCQLIESEIKFQENCKFQIESLKDRNEFLIVVKEKMQNSVNSLKPYNDFMEKIIEEMGNFKTVNEIINHSILLHSETVLQNQFSDNLRKNEIQHTRLLQNLKEKMATIVEQNNELFYTNKQLSYEINKLKRFKERLNQQNDVSDHQTEEIVLMKQSLHNIFYKLTTWKKISTRMNFSQKSTFIADTLDELRKNVQLARESQNTKNLSCSSNSSFLTDKRII